MLYSTFHCHNLILFPSDVSLRVSDGTFSWLPKSPPILKDINMEVPTGSLTAIVGQVGSGKSSLLSACVGDLYKKSGRVVSKVCSISLLNAFGNVVIQFLIENSQ